MTVGYSGTPLPRKLGIKPGHHVLLSDPPDDVDDLLVPLPDGVTVSRLPDTRPDVDAVATRPDVDVVVAFRTSYDDLARDLPGLGNLVFPAGSLWIAWPKRAAKVPTDVTEDRIRDAALPHGLVDNKVCAIDEIWSGLRLVWRRERRTPPA